jgi:D-3-phosphoglycerate dehydrogenase / 2-oxoglutarate reductase
MLSVLGIVPARGGSKGIPRKNLSLLRGRPLLEYTAVAALATHRLTRIVLSTEDEEIADVGRRCGLDVLFLRPVELARDDTPMLAVAQHAVEWLAAKGEQFDAVCVLQPTSPLREPEDIDGAIALMERTGADSVIAFVDVGEKQPARMKFVADDGRVIDPPFAELFEGQPRQQLPHVYLREGSIYLTRTAVLMEQHSFKGRDCRAWIVPEERACNIDTPFDLFIAEQLLARRLVHGHRRPTTAALGAQEHAPMTCPLPSVRPTILCAECADFPGRAAHRLRQVGTLVEADLDRGRLLAAVHQADVLWVRLRHRVDAEMLAAAPRLRIIVTPTTGLNHIDLEEAERRGIRVLALRGETQFLKEIRATAEHTIGLMLALVRHVPAAVEHVKAGGWNRDRFKGAELYGKQIGIIGYGRLGQIVARYLQAFDAELLTSDPVYEPEVMAEWVTRVPLDELLQRVDLVTVHVNLSPETRGFFGRDQFARMKKGAWFVNTARGELIDEGALLDALRAGHLAGAALDVLCDERAEGVGAHPLVAYAREHGHLLITPHIGGCSAESIEKAEMFMAERLLALLQEVYSQPSSSALCRASSGSK